MKRLALFGKRPVPEMPAHNLGAFTASLADGVPELALCTSCGAKMFPRPLVCGDCGGREFTPALMASKAELYAATTIHAAPGVLARLAPYTVALVDLEDGPRLLLRLFAADGWTPIPGTALKLFLADYEDGPVLAACPTDSDLTDVIHEPREAQMISPSRPDTTKALIARKTDGRAYSVAFEQIALSELPDGDVLVKISHTGLNYKDALALTGKAPIIRNFPMVLGIDLAGEVVDSRSPRFKPGDGVLVNGFGLSETRWGGYSQYQNLPEGFVLHQPIGLSAEHCMQIGTAGYTAMLCVMALENHGLDPDSDAVLVTGASGGVGAVAVSLLANRGYSVIAVTGRAEQTDFLRSLGARDVISREDLSAGGRAMVRERWAGAIDVAGGETLAAVIAQTRYDGIVASCGMAGGGDLPTSVFPFILRGVTLKGVDSVMVPIERRNVAWERLAAEMDRGLLTELSQTLEFEDLPRLGADLLEGRLKGRIAVRVPQ